MTNISCFQVQGSLSNLLCKRKPTHSHSIEGRGLEYGTTMRRVNRAATQRPQKNPVIHQSSDDSLAEGWNTMTEELGTIQLPFSFRVILVNRSSLVSRICLCPLDRSCERKLSDVHWEEIRGLTIPLGSDTSGCERGMRKRQLAVCQKTATTQAASPGVLMQVIIVKSLGCLTFCSCLRFCG